MQNDKQRCDFKDAGAFLWARVAERLARPAHVLLYPPGGGKVQPRGAVCLTGEASKRGLLIIKDKSVWTEMLAALQNVQQLYKLRQ